MASQVIWKGAHFLVEGELLFIDLAFLEVAALVEIEVVVSDLVSKLTNRWNLDGTRPVRVHEGLAECEVLDILLGDFVM